MPNWVKTHMTIYSQEEKDLHQFADLLERWLKLPSLAPRAWDGDNDWLGNILLRAGFNQADVLNDRLPFDYRGNIEDFDAEIKFSNSYYYFTLTTSTAWRPMPEMWEALIAKLYTEQQIKIAYYAGETGTLLFEKYDPDNLWYTDTDYFVEYRSKEEGAFSDFCDKQELLQLLQWYEPDEIISEGNLMNVVEKIHFKMKAKDAKAYFKVHEVLSREMVTNKCEEIF